MNLSILRTLGIVDCAILTRTDNNVFVLEDSAGDWITTLFPSKKHGDTISLDSNYIFLIDFLIDAEEFWRTQSHGQVKSGIWTEQIGLVTLYLEAYASSLDGERYLVIRNAEQMYHEKKETLQMARELTLSNNEVIERHDYLNQRLRSILLDGSNNHDRLPLHEAIRYASIGILILDAEHNVLDANPASFEIFDLTFKSEQNQLFDMIQKLMKRQYPEKTFYSDSKSWQGELFWHRPPLASKWMQVNLYPVLDATGKNSHWIVSINDQTRIKHLLQSNEELALHDPLTGLPNRQYFWQQLQQCISQQRPFYLVSIDIVNFKNANELYGYLEGDELLIQISKRIARELAEDDFVTRIGADEFMIIRRYNKDNKTTNNETFAEEAYTFAYSILNACSEPFYTLDNRRCELPLKMGMTQYPADAKKAEDLLNNADLALSFAKATANVSIQVYNEALKAVSIRRLMLEEALKTAIENDELELYLQPIYDLHSKLIVKTEALIRWHHAGELVMPAEFIPIAESSNSINSIGRWVIRRSCEITKELQDLGISIPISINFSPNQIHDIDLINFIQENIDLVQIDASLLELEVTEGVLINNYQKVSTFLHDLKRHGLSISVDDFGTGYCSLAYLKHLPIDTLKIDRAFIKDVNSSEDDGAIVSAIIALAQKLKLDIIAEGIENKEQQDFLIANNCHRAQGFFYSKPMPVGEFKRLFLNIKDERLI